MSGAYSMDDLPDTLNDNEKCGSCGVKMYFGHEHTSTVSKEQCDHSVKDPCGAVIQHTVVGTITCAAEKAECVMHNEEVRNEMLKAMGPFHVDQPEGERCICAAIKTKDGQTIIGHRHADAIKAATDRKLELLRESGGQGFITSKNRYVDRKEAMLIQKSAGIQSASEAGYLGDELYSEDLY